MGQAAVFEVFDGGLDSGVGGGATIVSEANPDPYVERWKQQEAEKKRRRDEEAAASG